MKDESKWAVSNHGYKSAVEMGAFNMAEVTGRHHKANARLIAAAPDLLDALAFLEPHLNALPIFEYERLKIRAAIAKATGA